MLLGKSNCLIPVKQLKKINKSKKSIIAENDNKERYGTNPQKFPR